MKAIQLTKRSDDHLLAHLYEHIFFAYLDTELRDQGLFPITDYALDAYTEDGQVVFDIEIYNEKTNVNNAIADAALNFLHNDEMLSIGIAQLESEHAKVIEIKDAKQLKKALHGLNDIEWNSDSVYEAGGGLNIANNIQLTILQITCDYIAIEKYLQPLYRQIAGLTLNICISDIADTYGGFVASEAFETDENHNLMGVVKLSRTVKESDVNKLLESTQEDLSRSGAYNRLLAILSDVSSLDNPPSNEQTYRDTEVMMNEEKWNHLANSSNLRQIVDKLHFQIRYM